MNTPTIRKTGLMKKSQSPNSFTVQLRKRDGGGGGERERTLRWWFGSKTREESEVLLHLLCILAHPTIYLSLPQFKRRQTSPLDICSSYSLSHCSYCSFMSVGLRHIFFLF